MNRTLADQRPPPVATILPLSSIWSLVPFIEASIDDVQQLFLLVKT